MISEEGEIHEGIVFMEELTKQYWKSKIKLAQQYCQVLPRCSDHIKRAAWIETMSGSNVAQFGHDVLTT